VLSHRLKTTNAQALYQALSKCKERRDNVEQTLRLIFRNAEGRTVTVSVNNPKDQLNVAEVNDAMDMVINSDLFQTSGGSITEKVRAEVVSRQVETILEF